MVSARARTRRYKSNEARARVCVRAPVEIDKRLVYTAIHRVAANEARRIMRRATGSRARRWRPLSSARDNDVAPDNAQPERRAAA